MKPCERKRASRRCATRCSRCRWTVSSVSTPASSKTTGRIGASRRQSASFWFCCRGARSVSRVAAQLGSVSARRSSGGKVQTGLPCSSRLSVRELGAQQLEGAGEGIAERLRLEPHPVARRFEQGLAALDLRLQIVLAFAGGLELLLGDALLLRVEVRLLDLAREPLGVAVADALPEAALDVVVDHLREAAELLLDGLRLPDEHLEHAVFDPLRQREVVAADFGGRLELAVDAAVALLDAPGFQGRSKWKRSVQCAWKFRPSRAASVASRMRSGSFAGSVLNRRWISLRRAPLVRPSITSMRSSARSVPSMACSRISFR